MSTPDLPNLHELAAQLHHVAARVRVVAGALREDGTPPCTDAADVLLRDVDDVLTDLADVADRLHQRAAAQVTP